MAATPEKVVEIHAPIVPIVPTAPPLVDLHVGQIVAFAVASGGMNPPVLRPLLVTSFSKVGDKLTARGLLIFDSENDRHQPWVQLKSKVTPLTESPMTWAEGPYGHNIGEWRYLGDLR